MCAVDNLAKFQQQLLYDPDANILIDTNDTNKIKMTPTETASKTLPIAQTQLIQPAAVAWPKRALDLIGATLGIGLILPLVPLIAIAIKIGTRGPILVKLERVSRNRIISLYKFRTMVADAHRLKPALAHLNERRDGPFFKIKNDPRLTRIGRLLRKFRIDEFPQLINVLKGELALVGPRPHEPEEILHYPEEYRHIIFAKAGVTGLSQVSGASSLPFLRELALDSYYVKNQSLKFDLKIIGKTAKILFSDPTAV